MLIATIDHKPVATDQTVRFRVFDDDIPGLPWATREICRNRIRKDVRTIADTRCDDIVYTRVVGIDQIDIYPSRRTTARPAEMYSLTRTQFLVRFNDKSIQVTRRIGRLSRVAQCLFTDVTVDILDPNLNTECHLIFAPRDLQYTRLRDFKLKGIIDDRRRAKTPRQTSRRHRTSGQHQST